MGLVLPDGGAAEANLDLSRRRADAVRGTLAAQLPGVEVSAHGRGEVHPAASNDTGEGRAAIRRVTISVA